MSIYAKILAVHLREKFSIVGPDYYTGIGGPYTDAIEASVIAAAIDELGKPAEVVHREARAEWAAFDTPVDDNGLLLEQFKHFPVGTNREDIWSWFEATYDVAVRDLMFPGEGELHDY